MCSILVIEADPGIATLIAEVLSGDTCRVHTAESGQAGLQLFSETPFDVVIADINMPGAGGFEVIREISRMLPRPRVIAMTGCAGRLNKEYLAEMTGSLGVHCLLFKPFSITELRESVFLAGEARC